MTFTDIINSTRDAFNRGKKRKLESKVDREKKRARFCENYPEITMNDLPNELLLEIFSYLDHNSLLCANIVNRNWNNLIVNTALNDKINRLYITAEKVDNYVPVLTRKYRSIRFDDVIEWVPELIAQLLVIGKDITELSLTECVFFEDDFIDLMQIFPNVKVMEISCVYEGIIPMSIPVTSDFEKIKMTSLKTLVIRGYSWPLSYISTPNLERFEAETLGLNDQDTFISFLNTQKRLETLRLVDINDLFESQHEFIRPQFKLKDLVMINLPFMDSTKVIRFLRCMENSVEYLDLGLELNVQICEYILLNFKKVYHLKIDYECFSKSRSFYQKMQVNKNLKFLALYGSMRSSKPLIYFLRKHPKIEELIMSELHGLYPQYKNFWQQFSALLPNLQTLSVHRFNSYNMVYIKQKHLKHLDVDYIGYATENVWIDFCKNNPNIESFHIFSRYQEYFKNISNIIQRSLRNLTDFFISN